MANAIPIIHITSDKEEDDDHRVLSMPDAFTDVEDVEETSSQTQKSKPKLLIKLTHDLGGNTDIENVEGSDSDDSPVIVTHKKRLSSIDFNLDGRTVEETCNITNRVENVNLKLHFQRSLTSEIEKQVKALNVESTLTDEEDLSVNFTEISSDIPDIPDIEINPEIFDCTDIVNTKGGVKYILASTPSPCITPLLCLSEDESSNKYRNNIKSLSNNLLSVSMFELPNVTDVEMLESENEDSDETIKRVTKIKKRRPRNKSQTKETPINIKFLNLKYQRNNKNIYHDNGGTTDIEEFEIINEYKYDTAAMNKKMGKIRYFYGSTKETMLHKRRRAKAYSNYNQSSDESGKRDEKSVKQKYSKKQSKPTIKYKQFIHLPETETCLTDVENIACSDIETIDDILIKPKHGLMTEDLTEEEIILTKNDYLRNLPDTKLPAAKREITFIKENDVGTPTTIVTPLEEVSFGLAIAVDGTTDVESFSGGESDYEQIIERTSPGLYDIDNETTEEHEFLKSLKQTLHIPLVRTDNATDTEEITLNVENKNRQMRITVNKQDKSALTDTEEIYFSDIDIPIPKSNVRNKQTKESDANESKITYVPFTESVKNKGHRNVININSFEHSPILGNSNNSLVLNHASRKAGEDFAASDKVLYLKGGSYFKIPADKDSLLENEKLNVCEEWSAPHEQSKDKPPSTVADQGAAMQGEASGIQQWPEQQSTPQTFARAEAEETTSQRKTSDQDRPVADQHMLSEEMKKLLKELEDESKK